MIGKQSADRLEIENVTLKRMNAEALECKG